MDIVIWTRSVERGDKTVPSNVENSAQRWTVFSADGKVLIRSARNPFFEAARLFIAAGRSPDDMLWLVRPGAKTTEHWLLRSKLGFAATRRVDEAHDDRPASVQRFMPYPGANVVA